MFHDLACMTSATTGTGTLTLGTAARGFLSFASAGVTNGEVVRYSIRDGANSETGIGTYTTSGTTLSRDTVLASTNSNNKISCSGTQRVFITLLSLDANCIDPYGLHHRLSGSNAWDDEFDSDTSGDYTEVAPTGTNIWTIGNHSLAAYNTDEAANDANAYLKALTIADGEWLETNARLLTPNAQNYSMYGLILTDGTSDTSNALCLNAFQSAAGNQLMVRFDYGTITNLASSNSDIEIDASGKGDGIRMQLIRNSSTDYSWKISTVNGTYASDFGASSSVNPGFTPTHGGVWVSTWGNSHHFLAVFDYLRLMS